MLGHYRQGDYDVLTDDGKACVKRARTRAEPDEDDEHIDCDEVDEPMCSILESSTLAEVEKWVAEYKQDKDYGN